MSFGNNNDEFLSLPLIELLSKKDLIMDDQILCSIIPEFSNYDLKSGFRFELSFTPIVYEIYIGERYTDGLRPNDFQLFDHLEINIETVNENDLLAFNEKDYRRIKKITGW